MKYQHSILTIILSISIISQALGFTKETEDWLNRLDAVVAQREAINLQKHARLTEMRMHGSTLSSLEEVFQHNAQIYEECFTFDSELAMEVAEANIEIAKQMKNAERLLDWTLKCSFILASTGQLLESSTAVEDLQAADLPHSLRIAYYDQMQYLYQHLSQYSWNKPLKQQYDNQARAYSDSLFQIIQPGDKDYLWFRSWRYMYIDCEGAIRELSEAVDNSELKTRDDAKLAYALARAYDLKEDKEKYIQYMCRSGIADILAANQDIASLEEMSMVLYEHGDLARAYTYINVCLETARIYNNLVRTVSIAPTMDQILASYTEREAKQREHTQWLLIGLSIAFILAVGGGVMVALQKRSISRQRAKLRESNQLLNKNQNELAHANQAMSEANVRLQELMQAQKIANAQLQESNFIKEEYIGYVFSLCSSYISKMDEYRKNINRKAKVKQYDEILTLTDKSSLVQDELKEFYQNFDALFLNVYPTFIDDFNALLLPEERIEPRKGELLNTDLRIYALVRLGITDSVKIAEFLHVSTQTVYNNRLKIRNKAVVSKEEFIEQVRRLGSVATHEQTT